jgi:hypothetical protein
VEVWSIEDRDPDELERETKKSILNNIEAQTFLEMSGKTMFSQGLRREEDYTEEI